MNEKAEGVEAPFLITKITILIGRSATDVVRIDTTLPLAVWPYRGTQTLSMEVAGGHGIEYVRQHFKDIEPEVIQV